MDLVSLDGNNVLLIVDKAMHFSVATFLDANSSHYGQSVEGVWLSFEILGLQCTQGIQTDSLRMNELFSPLKDGINWRI